jgi:succinate dehydrogenase / fumarate reductase cytochrome b subunit
MNMLLRPVQSSLGSKYVMAVTGLGLIGFVLGHLGGNLLIYAGRDALNAYGHALESRPAFLWTARIVLLAIFLIHVALGLRLWRQNRVARPIRYFYEDTVQATWASRHMLLTGLVILAFLVYHLLHFTFGVTDRAHFKYQLPADPATHYRDVAAMVVGGFAQPAVSLGYVVAQVFLGLHLWHGAGSWFQSLGLNGRRSLRGVRIFGMAVAAVVVMGNCSIPLAILLGWRPA